MLRIYPTPPFRLDLTVQPLARGSENLLDRWDGAAYRRVFVRKNRPAELSLIQEGTLDRPALVMEVRGLSMGAENKVALLPTLSHMLGFGLQLEPFLEMAACDPQLQQLIDNARELKPSRFATAFEALVNAFALEQAGDDLAIVNRFIQSFGVRFENRPAFPRPQDVSGRTTADLTAIGFSTEQAATLLDLAARLNDGRMDFKSWHRDDDATVVSRFAAMPGVSRGIAEYAALMGLGRLDVFPTNRPVILEALKSWLGLTEIPDSRAVAGLLSPWQPYQGMIYFHLLRKIATPG